MGKQTIPEEKRLSCDASLGVLHTDTIFSELNSAELNGAELNSAKEINEKGIDTEDVSAPEPEQNRSDPTAAELQTLRRLLLGTSIEESVRGQLSPKVIGQILPAAFSEAYERQAGITVALTPTVEKAIQHSVQRDSATLAEALFPVIGPATRKSIASALGSLVESLNQTLEHSLSLESFKWRLEARRTGKTFAEVVLIRTLIYQVEQIFLIHKPTGLLIQHVAIDQIAAQDPDLVSAMLTAIQDFVQDSFSVNADESLDTLKLGDFTLFIESGPQAVLAAVTRGTAPQALRATMRSQLEKIHAHFGSALRNYAGDQTTLLGTTAYIQDCFQSKFKGKQKVEKKPLSPSQKKLVWCLAALLVSGLCLRAFFHWQSSRHWQQFIGTLQKEPGLVVIDHSKRGGTFHLHGLRDPLASDPQRLLADSKLRPSRVELSWSPYLSLAPEFLQYRVNSLLSPPQSVSIDLSAEGVLHLSGRATASWIATAKRASEQIEGISGWDDTELVALEQEEFLKLRDRIEYRRFLFTPGTASLSSPRYSQTLYNQTQDIKKLIQTATALGQETTITLYAHGDQRGSQPQTLALAAARGQYIFNYLVEQGISENVLQVEAQAIKTPTNTLADNSGRRLAADEEAAAYLKVKR